MRGFAGSIDDGPHSGTAWSTLADLAHAFVDRLPFIMIGLLVLATFVVAGQVLKRLIIATGRRTRLHATLSMLLGRIASAAMIVLGLFVSAVVVFPAFKPGDLVAGLGITSIAVGFAFKDILQNFLAGLLILWRQPFRIGDQVRTGDVEGTVEEINTRSTRIKTYDGELVTVPNMDVYSRAILVRTAFGVRRSRFTVGVGYSDSLDMARETLERVIRQTDGVLSNPEPWVHVTELAPSSVNFTVYFWTDARQTEVLQTGSRVACDIKRALDDAGIDIPYPHTVVLQKGEQDGRKSEAP
ncbi:MAG TPA: mechanosensitive ion channel family protein [Nitrospira sp.]|nr:mechanosensitive ion channel family protein [Nitrospira sp.]